MPGHQDWFRCCDSSKRDVNSRNEGWNFICCEQEHGHRAPNASKAVAFVQANLQAGLRLSEWFGATLASRLFVDDDGNYIVNSRGQLKFDQVLVVQNAKSTHGRGNGPRRELVLHGISATELSAIVNFLRIVHAFKER